MPDLTRRQLALCVAGALLALVLGVRQLGVGARSAAPAPAAALKVEAPRESRGGVVRVHVAGAVRRPGVYRLPGDARVDEAVARAGGARRRADLSALNLAAKVEDGRQVLVPARAQGGTAGTAESGEPAEGQPLNVNTATLEQLDELSGVGPVTAQKILDAREERGGFSSIEELGEIPGIGDVRLASLREELTL